MYSFKKYILTDIKNTHVFININFKKFQILCNWRKVIAEADTHKRGAVAEKVEDMLVTLSGDHSLHGNGMYKMYIIPPCTNNK